jgi:hypothetical protein
VQRFKEALIDMNPVEVTDHDILFSVSNASDVNLLKSDDGLPMVAHMYYCYESICTLLCCMWFKRRFWTHRIDGLIAS